MSMGEGAATSFQCVDDPLTDQNSRDGAVSSTKYLSHGLNVRGNVIVLPGVLRSGAAKSAHNLVEYQKGSMPVTDFPYCT
jgi:hypothetical protein